MSEKDKGAQAQAKLPEQPSKATSEGPFDEPKQASDKTVPGGRYLVNGRVVDANGEPIKE